MNPCTLKKLQIGANGFKGSEAGKALGDAIALNTVLEELDLSVPSSFVLGDRCDAAFLKEFAVGLSANRVLLSLNIGNNSAGNWMYAQPNEEDADGWAQRTAEPAKEPTGIIALAFALENNRTLEKLDISDNELGNKGSEAIAEALRENKVMKDLNISENGAGPKCAQILADGVIANGALTTIIFGDKHAVTMKADMTEADLSGKQLGASGAIIAAAFLPKCR